jgi:hypothetical protein
MAAAIMVTARSDIIFTGTCSPKMDTIDIGNREGDPDDAGPTKHGIRTPSMRHDADRHPRMTGLRPARKAVCRHPVPPQTLV